MAARDLGNTSDPYVTLSIDGALSPYIQLDPTNCCLTRGLERQKAAEENGSDIQDAESAMGGVSERTYACHVTGAA